MSWRERKRWVGLLAFLAPLPLPFNEMASWFATVAFLCVVAGFLVGLQRGATLLLAPWVLNLAGALYFPALFLDLASAQSGQILRPLVHVAMFATAAKLFALRTERDKWHAILGAFFLFVAGMGSSVHPALIVHLLVFSSVTVAGLVHFAEAHSQRSFPQAQPIAGKARLTSAVIASTIVGGAVMFPFLPRINQPYVAGGGAMDLGGAGGVSAFVDDLTLDSIGRIRTDRGVALRLVFDGPVPDEIRLKGSSYDVYRDNRWIRTQGRKFVRSQSGQVVLSDQVPLGEVEVLSRMTGTRMMPTLAEVVTVEVEAPGLGVAPGGDLRPSRWRGSPLRYRMAYGREPARLATDPPNPETLDESGITPRIAEYAQPFFAGSRSTIKQILALEEHFQQQFSYTLDLDLDPAHPVEDFLFNQRAGHCEYFASSMVLLLRSQGIPARVVSGFLGADGNPLESFFVVRNSNAHAWVEAYVEGNGWITVDPTPAIGRPQIGRSGSSWMGQIGDVYDWLIYRWDRYVLTFGSQDQSGIFASIGAWFKELWASWREDAEEQSTELVLAANADEISVTDVSHDPLEESLPSVWLVVAAVLLAIALGLFLWWRHERQSFNATDLYLRLRAAAPAAGLEVNPTSAPVQLVDAWINLTPDAQRELRAIFGAYLEESFGGRELERPELLELEQDFQVVVRSYPRVA